MQDKQARLPFAGIRVLDFSRVLAGPFCTALMADMGAEIIKVESPQGDDQRWMGAFRDGVDESLSFELINRSKRSIVLDLKQDEGREIARELAAGCDVVVENFRPGVAAKLGIDHATLAKDRPDLIYCSISGFGQDGPMAKFPSYDVVAQALSGLMSITGEADGKPTIMGESVGDTAAGLFAAWGIASALFRRERTGEGALLDVAMFDALFALMPTALAQWQVAGEAPTRHGNQHPLSAPFGSFAASDSDFIIAIANNALFARFAAAIGKPGLAEDARFATDKARRANRDALRAEIEAWSANLTAAEAVESLGAAGIPAAEIWSVSEAAQSPQARHRKLLTEVAHDGLGTLNLPEQPVQIAHAPRGAMRAAPRLGADGRAILRDLLGRDETDLDRLARLGVI